MGNQKMQNEQWYRDIASELRQYKKYKARIGTLEARMIRQIGPINNWQHSMEILLVVVRRK